MDMTQALALAHPDQQRLQDLDGSFVEVGPARERADIVLHHPPYNVASVAARDQLRAVFEALDADDRMRVIIMRALGAYFFNDGDIKDFPEASPEYVSKLTWNVATPTRCSKSAIAANQSYCFGVGFELSLACDFHIATHTTKYALPERKLGQVPGSDDSARLQKMVGVDRTRDIVMRSRRVSGLQAYDWGIAVDCATDGDLTAATDALVDKLHAFSPLAQRTAKKLLNNTEDAPLSTAIELGGHCYGRLRNSDDFREDVEAFRGKHKPVFRDS